MDSMLGKIVLENSNPVVIISEDCEHLRGLKIVKSVEECSKDDRFSYLKISSDELIKIKYRGKKLDNAIIDYHGCTRISNLKVREIGALTEEGYCNLLRKFSSYHASCGGKDAGYLSVRQDVHEQLITRISK